MKRWSLFWLQAAEDTGAQCATAGEYSRQEHLNQSRCPSIPCHHVLSTRLLVRTSLPLACRPLKAQVHNCQLLVDLAGRNAVWGAAAHLFMAFKPVVPTAMSNASVHSPSQGSSLQRGTSGLQRGTSGLQRGHSGLPSPRTGGAAASSKGLLGQGSFTHQGQCLSLCSNGSQVIQPQLSVPA